MSRWLVVLAVLALVVVTLLGVTTGFFQPPAPVGGAVTLPLPAPTVAHAKEPVAPAPPAGPVGQMAVGRSAYNYLAISDCRLTAIDKNDVPAKRDGQLMYIATDWDRKGPRPSDEDLITLNESYVYIEVPASENVPEGERHTRTVDDGKEKKTLQYRRLRPTDVVPMDQLERLILVQAKPRVLRKLHENDEVADGQLVALIDPDLTADEFVNKQTKVEAAKADWQASLKTRDEAEERYKTLLRLFNGRAGRVVGEEELRGGKLTYEKYLYEEVSKKEAIKAAKAEQMQALTTLRMHEVRSKVSGIVKGITKQRGDAIKNLDTLMTVVNHDKLRVEGEVGMQHLAFLNPNENTFVVEPTMLVRPLMVLPGHMYEVKCIAVSKNRSIVSGSEDRTVRVWDLKTGKHTILPHPAEVRAVACTSPEAAGDLCLSGCADGLGRLWDLAAPEQGPVRELKERHKGPITSVAFSPNGKWCVTGGIDRTIRIWDVATGDLVQPALTDAHRGEVSSLQFLSDQELVSAGEKSLVLWKLNEDGTLAEKTPPYDRRSGDVPQLGVNPARKQALIDVGRELRIVSVLKKEIEGVLQNSSGVTNFTTMAQFSPDGKLILTYSSSEGRLQLWRGPTETSRAHEIRQFAWQGDQITCGAFVPRISDSDADNFVVTGTKDHQVVVWALPTQTEVDLRLTAKLRMVDQSLESNARQVRIWAELPNPKLADGRRVLMPGQSAAIVVYPKK